MRIEHLRLSHELIIFNQFEIEHVAHQTKKHLHGVLSSFQVLDDKFICDSTQDDINEHESCGQRRTKLMRHHRRVTFEIPCFAILLDYFAL